MKAKNFYLPIALCVASLAFANIAFAQDDFVDEAVSVTEFSCDNTTRYFSNWRNNWFVELGAGAGQPLVEKGFAGKQLSSVDKKKWTVSYSVGFGRWISPYVGFRMKAMGGALHWDCPTVANPKNGWSKSRHVNMQAEFMWDMLNSVAGVNSQRVMSIIPFVGLGGDCNWHFRGVGDNQPSASNDIRAYSNSKLKSVQWTLPVSAGIQFRFRLCKYADFFCETRAAFYADNWNNVVHGSSIEAHISSMAGFNFNIGERDWKSYNECNYMSQIAALNGQVNNLRAELLACGMTIAELQAQLPCPESVTKTIVSNNTPIMTTVRFSIGSDVITPEEEVNIYSMAQWLKENPKEKIVIAGYADKDTGTAEYNMQLSERRAEAVKNQLVNEYGVDSGRLQIKAFGSDQQQYPDHNDWNRIVIFRQ